MTQGVEMILFVQKQQKNVQKFYFLTTKKWGEKFAKPLDFTGSFMVQ